MVKKKSSSLSKNSSLGFGGISMKYEKKAEKASKEYQRPISFSLYGEEIKKASPRMRKEMYKIQQKREKDFEKTEAKVRLGIIPSLGERYEELEKQERKEKIDLAKKRLSGIGQSAMKLLTSKGERTILQKPTAKLPSTDPKKFVTSGLGRPSLVREGRTGYFNKEMMEEAKWF
jgi:hypothetical protein